ncbi:Cof-type HAD-IIB family hydrolase [Paenibacillus puerhi]|uniref:Cof-type HAD-IIB family hydrolase n=1 Tax=Paenibacillus puerhi TaxID=2692622 RepID=UPI00135A8266|nr:Cof-type HAD-IIB family hydrolase [Paenibacillus puerhi]
MNYKILFSDIDGTLLNSKSQISQETLKAIRSLRRSNIPFVLVSARMPKGIEPYQNQIGTHEAMICFSGALVLGPLQSNGHREIIRNIPLSSEEIQCVYSLIQPDYDITISFYNKDEWYAEALDEAILQESGITSIQPNLCELKAMIKKVEMNKMLCIGNPKHIEYLQADISKHYPKLTVYKSKSTYLEIMAPQVSKSSAMDKILEYYNFTRDITVAIGDYYNDIDMLQNAGLGVAMGNAPEDVKKYADEITASNDEDGLKLIIEKYFC